MKEPTAGGDESGEGLILPPPPVEPEPGECCGRGCERCVYVYYEEALERWREKVAAIKARHSMPSP